MPPSVQIMKNRSVLVLEQIVGDARDYLRNNPPPFDPDMITA